MFLPIYLGRYITESCTFAMIMFFLKTMLIDEVTSPLGLELPYTGVRIAHLEFFLHLLTTCVVSTINYTHIYVYMPTLYTHVFTFYFKLPIL